MKITEETKIPRKEGFAEFLTAFVHENKITVEKFALGLGCSIYTIERLMKGKTFPSEVAYAEFSLAFILITAKGLDYYVKLNQEDKEKIVAKLVAAGGSTLSIGGMIGLISSMGFAGLSAAGITSGLAAIGAVIGGGMLSGIAIVAAAPLLIGGALYWLFSSDDEKLPNFIYAYKDRIDLNWEEQI